MSLSALLLLLLASYGVTFTLIDAAIFDFPRKLISKIKFFREMLRCYFCTGFWAGMIVALLYVLTLSTLSLLQIFGFIVLLGFASATSSYAIDLKLSKWEAEKELAQLMGSNDEH